MREKLTVIKVGGKIVEEEATLLQLLNDFAAISGHKVLVHGGGPEITETLSAMGKESRFVGGLRYTDEETVRVVQMVLAGKTNKEIVDYMVERYGDFVLYKPPFKANTVILWLGPVALFLVGLAAFYLNLRRRKSAVAKTVRPLTAEEKARADKLLSGDKE